MVRRVVAGCVLVAMACFGCGSRLQDIPVAIGRPPDVPPGAARVELRYLGNGGWLIRRGGDVIATAPFVSNPGGVRVYLPGGPDAGAIATLVPEMADVEIMLIGHGHYDHAMDLPLILGGKAPGAGAPTAKAPKATLFGSRTVKHLLGPQLASGRVESVSDDEDGEGTATGGGAARKSARGSTPGAWFPSAGATVRFMPLASTHAPHLLGFVKLVSSGRLKHDVETLPGWPFLWPEGETLAFLIDFLNPKDGAVEFRIYYQDTASYPGTGVVPTLTGRDAAPVDVAILCVAGFSQVPDNPEHILGNVQPRYIVGGHWEDFVLWPDRDVIRSAPGTSIGDFFARAAKVSPAPIYLVEPGKTLTFPVHAR
jgi:hypothetical protein